MVGAPLSAAARAAFDHVDRRDRERARIVVVPVLTPGVVGMTLGRFVLLRRGHERDAGLLAHELVHVQQWREQGALGFLRSYVGAYVAGRRAGLGHWAAYRDIPQEAEARARSGHCPPPFLGCSHTDGGHFRPEMVEGAGPTLRRTGSGCGPAWYGAAAPRHFLRSPRRARRSSVSGTPPTPFPPRPPVGGLDSWRERAWDRARDPRLRTAALLVLAAVVGLVWYQTGRRSASGALDDAVPHVRPAPTTTTTRPPLLVHVAGAVARPGLVEVATGGRVADAITAAGGGLPDADLDRLNLAAPVTDGERVAVARVGEPAPPVAAGSAGGTAGSGAGDAAGPIDLNTATADQLDTLPGIGPTLAGAIIRERERRGGFTDVGQLRDVRGIGDARFADIRDLVVV